MSSVRVPIFEFVKNDELGKGPKNIESVSMVIPRGGGV